VVKPRDDNEVYDHGVGVNVRLLLNYDKCYKTLKRPARSQPS